jgi:hypothetical protein
LSKCPAVHWSGLFCEFRFAFMMTCINKSAGSINLHPSFSAEHLEVLICTPHSLWKHFSYRNVQYITHDA